MFCDMVGSTELSSRLDPEDLRDVIRLFQNVCTEVVVRYGGFIAAYPGDGILILATRAPTRTRPSARCARGWR
jgi:class 3 adenylate cyclase